MLHIILWEPEIPPNTGNIARLCAATGASLHLVGRLGFQIDDHAVRRAGLDYWDHVSLSLHDSLQDMTIPPDRIYGFSARANRLYTEPRYQDGDWLLFGNESSGLPETVHQRYKDRMLTVPMLTPHVRSLNLATTVGIVLFEALRQIHQWH